MARKRKIDKKKIDTKLADSVSSTAIEVDPECVEKVSSAIVYCEDEIVWDAMLNQTNIQFNNNKYYKMQIIKDNVKDEYHVWFHWGRVGKNGQKKLQPCKDLDEAKDLFKQKFFDKTKNEWEDRNQFEKVNGKYDLVKINHQMNKDIKEKKLKKLPPSTLDPKLQELIQLIFNQKIMEDALKTMEYDVKKAPLGNLTHEQVIAGYSALKAIEDLVIKKQTSGNKILQACNDFYTRIPHYFGMRKPPMITTLAQIQEKLQLLDTLGDIQAAMQLIGEEKIEHKSLLDLNYESLNCELTPMDPADPDYKILEKALMNTHAGTHKMYNFEIEAIFKCNREDEEKNFIDHGNKMLLWHGSRLSNYAGILSQGLRIAPPEAPVTGYMFGKGIYFADMSSKSANYCYTNKNCNTGLLLLSEVSLGKQDKLLKAKSDADKLKTSKHSVMGLGKNEPDKNCIEKLSDGTLVNTGKETSTGVDNSDGYTLMYNEYIVYNPKQVKMKYLLKIKFIYLF